MSANRKGQYPTQRNPSNGTQNAGRETAENKIPTLSMAGPEDDALDNDEALVDEDTDGRGMGGIDPDNARGGEDEDEDAPANRTKRAMGAERGRHSASHQR